MMRQRRVSLALGTVLGAALPWAPVPVAEAFVPDLDPSPSRVVIRDPVRDIWNQVSGVKTQREAPSINLTRLEVTYGRWALRLRSSLVDLRRKAAVRRGGTLGFRIGTPRRPFKDQWEAYSSGNSSGTSGVSIGAEEQTCPTAIARWAYREDFVTIRVPWSCLQGIGTAGTPPRRVIVHGISSLGRRVDYVPGRPGRPNAFTPPVVRPDAS